MEGTVFTPSLEGMKHVKSENGEILTKPFLDVCKHILPVLGTWHTLHFSIPEEAVSVEPFALALSDKFGAAMAIVKSDIGGNITVSVGLDDMKAS
ncbi:hypothetical protein GW17_00022105 [Ensete ventricosum]|uniref:Uncharacterized protein n=1 Tax=Ensete ventricosum TaxID=4639 RepID=A0A426YCZ2_ENSVE|nr:hypothetical protein B296_00052319 [Ensete ventricosum]RWW14140.1 hypothetical protein GW17_00022105 [Ensete ventricosum]